MLKVLHVYRTYYPDPAGGMQEAIRQICLAVKPYGVENTIFTLSPNPTPAIVSRPEAMVVRCRSWAAPASCDLGGAAAFARFRTLAGEADLVHYLFPWPFADLLHQTVRPDVPVVLTYVSDIVRQLWLSRAYSPLMRRTLSRARAIVANVPAYAKTSAILSAPSLRERVRIIPLGIDENSYPIEGDSAIFSRLGIEPSAPYFLFVGVLRYYKGLHTLLSAARSVEAPVIIAGSGPEEGRLRSQAAELGIDNVIFAGQVTDLEKVALYQSCSAFILPSHLRSEAFGMVLVEASMYGKPMISCEIGTGTSFINVDRVTGFVLPPEAPDEMAKAMNLLLKKDELAAEMGRAARERYEHLFSEIAVGRAYSDLFHELVS